MSDAPTGEASQSIAVNGPQGSHPFDEEFSDGRFSKSYRIYFLVLAVVVSAFSVIDRTALVTMGQAIKQDLSLSDLQFGILTGFGFVLFYALLGLPLARIADTKNRCRLITVAIGVFSVFVTLCGLVRSFLQLMICRVVVGVGEAGVQPPTISVISDLYPPRRRGSALAILSIGVPVGTLVGPIAGGFLAQAYSWRVVFLLLGIPGALITVLAWLTLREPPRGLSEKKLIEQNAVAPGVLAVCRHLAARASFWHFVAGVAVANFAAAGISSFLPQFFTRSFGLSMSMTGVAFGVMGAISTLVGTYSGGVLVDQISRHDQRWYAWLPALGVGIAAPMYVASFLIPSFTLVAPILTVGGAALFLYYTPSQVVLQNMVEPQMRATAAFVFFLVSSLVGFGFGPALMGFVSDKVAAHAFHAGSYAALCPGGIARPGASMVLNSACKTAAATGLRDAMSLMGAFFLWAALHFALAARTLRQDLMESSAQTS